MKRSMTDAGIIHGLQRGGSSPQEKEHCRGTMGRGTARKKMSIEIRAQAMHLGSHPLPTEATNWTAEIEEKQTGGEIRITDGTDPGSPSESQRG